MIRQSKKILRELDIPETNGNYVKLRELLGNNLGYLGKFTQWLFQDNIPLSQLETLLNELRNIRLGKSIDQFDTAEDLYDYITELKADTQVNQTIQLLPKHARNVVDNKVRNLIKNNLRHIDHIKHLYKTRSSAYRSSEDIYQNTITWINNVTGGWNADAINYLPEELVYKDDFTLILHISDYDRSCELGSAMWCISTDKYHWDEYTSEFKKQYFIYDFTRDIGDDRAMIGITINLDGSVNVAHIRNNDMIDPSMIMEEYGEYLTPYNKEYIKSLIDINNFNEVVRYGLIEEVKRLIKQGHDPSDNNNYAIRMASRYGHLNIVKELLKDERVDPSDNDNYAIRWASENGHLGVVKELLKDDRVDPSANNNWVIRIASLNGHTEIVKELLKDKRMNPSGKDNVAIAWASTNGHLEVVRELLKDERVNPSVNDNQAIRWASRNGHKEVVKELLKDKRVDPSDDNNYVIRWASENGHKEIVELLKQDPRSKRGVK